MPQEVTRAFLPQVNTELLGAIWVTMAGDPEGPSEISSSNHPTYRSPCAHPEPKG